MKNKELFLALEEMARAYKLEESLLIESLEKGLAAAFKKETSEARAVAVKMNPLTYTIEFFAYQTVVDGEPLTDSELSLEEARDIKPDAQIGDIIGENVDPDDLSRIASQTAKQVFTQNVNEAKRAQVMSEMKDREGELMSAMVRRVEGNGTVSVEISGTQVEGILGTRDQVRGEKLNVGDTIKVYVKKINEDFNKDGSKKDGSRVFVSRSCAGFVKKLFEIEVPELRTGLIKVKSIVREAGLRTKMSVYSEDPNIDAQGACIGPKGARVNAIVNELNGEKVDVIPFSNNPSEYIVKALSPAKVIMVQLREETKEARVIVPDDKLSLAIGKGGQNAKLAAKLTGYKIDVKPYSVAIADDDNMLNMLGDQE